MKNTDTQRRLYVLLVSGMSIGLQTLLIGFVWYQYYNPIIRIPFWTKGHWYILTLYCLILTFFTHIYGGFKIGYLKKWDAMFSQIFAAICSNIIFYAEIGLLAYYFPTPIPLLKVSLIIITFILIWLQFTTFLYSHLFPPHRVLLVYGADLETEARNKLAERKDKFNIVSSICANENFKQLEQFLLSKEIDAVIFWGVSNLHQNDLIKSCYHKRMRIYTVPKIPDILLSGAEVMHFFDTPMLLIRSNPLSIDQRFIKRVADFILSLFMIILASPLMLLTAVSVKLYDRGPVLYKQIRCTLNGKEFNIYKYRSMKINAEQDGIPQLASDKDSRITPVGRVIRKMRIDELPQLFNILRGDMSFVGPRPERPEIIKQYIEELPEFNYRLHVKAGLTGYAQIYGKYNTKAHDKLKLDLYYIEHYSLWLDLKLLILTSKIIFSPESTEGVKNAD